MEHKENNVKSSPKACIRTCDNECICATSIVVSARNEADVGKLASSDVWAETEADENQRVWTDDYSNVFGAVYRRLRDGEQ
jgi:hypothetical protein